MPTCDVCGEEDFYLQDGFYFCSQCQTQSQQVREVGTEDDFQATFITNQYAVSTQEALEAKQNKAKRKAEVYTGRPWLLEEGFTLILKSQVEALLKHGAKPELKDAVFKLWTYYLGKLKVAFCKRPDWTDNKLCRDVRHKCPAVASKRRIKTMKNKKNDLSKQKERLQMERLLQGEEFYEGDNPTQCKSDEESGSDASDAEAGDKHSEKYQVDRMTVLHTLQFLHLGLLFSGHNVSVIQVMRMAKEGIFPYINVRSCLPEDIKFRPYDAIIFSDRNTPNIGRAWVLAENYVTLCRFLDLKQIPQPDICKLTAAYCVSLALPGEIHGHIRNLMKILPPKMNITNRESAAPDYDTFAMAYIIIALKVLLGLNDVRERLLCGYARELTKVLKLKQKLFIWDEWVNFHEKRKQEQVQHSLPRNVREAGNIKTLTHIIEKMENKNDDTRLQMSAKLKYHHKKPDSQREIAKPLNSLLSSWSGSSQLETPESDKNIFYPSTVGLTSATFEDDWWFDNDDTPGGSTSQGTSKAAEKPTELKQTLQPNLTKEEQEFCGSTLRFITEGVEFLEHLGDHGLANATLSAYHSMTEEGPSSSAFQSTVAAVRRLISLGLQEKHVVDEDDPLTQLSHRLSLTNNRYVFYGHKAKLHSSYKWLLELGADLIFTTPEFLHRAVRGMEGLIFARNPEVKKFINSSGSNPHVFAEHFDVILKHQSNIIEIADTSGDEEPLDFSK